VPSTRGTARCGTPAVGRACGAGRACGGQRSAAMAAWGAGVLESAAVARRGGRGRPSASRAGGARRRAGAAARVAVVPRREGEGGEDGRGGKRVAPGACATIRGGESGDRPVEHRPAARCRVRVPTKTCGSQRNLPNPVASTVHREALHQRPLRPGVAHWHGHSRAVFPVPLNQPIRSLKYTSIRLIWEVFTAGSWLTILAVTLVFVSRPRQIPGSYHNTATLPLIGPSNQTQISASSSSTNQSAF